MTPPPSKFQAVKFIYTNWKGETELRIAIPERIYFGSNRWHTEEQWLMDAWDMVKNEPRTFAMKDIKNWAPVPTDSGIKSG